MEIDFKKIYDIIIKDSTKNIKSIEFNGGDINYFNIDFVKDGTASFDDFFYQLKIEQDWYDEVACFTFMKNKLTKIAPSGLKEFNELIIDIPLSLSTHNFIPSKIYPALELRMVLNVSKEQYDKLLSLS